MREQLDLPAVPDVLVRPAKAGCNGDDRFAGAPVTSWQRLADAAGGARERVVRGPADQVSSWLVREVRKLGLRGGIAWIVMEQGRLRLAIASMCDRRNRALQPRSKRCRDRRCSSGSSLGQAPSGVRMPAQRTMSASGRASSRGDRYAARLRARAPWFVKPRRVSGGKLRSCRGNVARAEVEARCPLERVIDEADGAPTLPGGFLQVQRELDA